MARRNLLRSFENHAKGGTETAQKEKSKFSRNDIRYWEQRVYQPAFKDENGSAKLNGRYHVKIQAHGERRGVSLQATTVRSAAKAAKELDALVRLKGWDEGLQLFRGEIPKPKITLTLGEYLSEVEALGMFKPRTLSTYYFTEKNLLEWRLKRLAMHQNNPKQLMSSTCAL